MHSGEAVCQSLEVQSNDEVTTKALSRENSALRMSLPCPRKLSSCLPQSSHISAIASLQTIILYGGPVLIESMLPSTLPASSSRSASASNWRPNMSDIRVAVTPPGMRHFSIASLRSQTRPQLGTRRMPRGSPLIAQITDTLKSPSRDALSKPILSMSELEES